MSGVGFFEMLFILIALLVLLVVGVVVVALAVLLVRHLGRGGSDTDG